MIGLHLLDRCNEGRSGHRPVETWESEPPRIVWRMRAVGNQVMGGLFVSPCSCLPKSLSGGCPHLSKSSFLDNIRIQRGRNPANERVCVRKTPNTRGSGKTA